MEVGKQLMVSTLLLRMTYKSGAWREVPNGYRQQKKSCALGTGGLREDLV